MPFNQFTPERPGQEGPPVDRLRRILLLLAAFNGLVAVAVGAFAAHGVTDPQAQTWLRTGSHYQLVHALAALGTLSLLRLSIARLPAWLFILGALLFAGSLYLLALTGWSQFGVIAPVGGMLLILGWAALARCAFYLPPSR